MANNFIQEFKDNLSAATNVADRSFVDVLSSVLPAMWLTIQKFSEWTARQALPTTADNKDVSLLGLTFNPLVEHASTVGAGPLRQPVAGVYELAVTVVNSGSAMPEGTKFKVEGTDIMYSTKEEYFFPATGGGLIEVTCDTAGANYPLVVGGSVVLTQPLSAISSLATVSEAVTVGLDVETTESFRNRIIARYQGSPNGFTYSNIAKWGLGAAGTSRIFPYRTDPRDEIRVYVESTAGASPTPILEGVLDELEKSDRMPAGTKAQVLSVSFATFSVEIDGLDPVTAEVKTAVFDGLDEYFKAKEPYIEGFSKLPRLDRVSAPEVSGVVSSIVASFGAVIAGVTLTYNSIPVATPFSLSEGEVARLGAVTYA